MSDNGEHDRLYNPDGTGCVKSTLLVVALMALLLVLPGVLIIGSLS